MDLEDTACCESAEQRFADLRGVHAGFAREREGLADSRDAGANHHLVADFAQLTGFRSVADELHRQYLIGFEPQKLDDKMHKLEVRVKKPGAKVRARKEYQATK